MLIMLIFYKSFGEGGGNFKSLGGSFNLTLLIGMLGFATADYFTAEFHKYTGKRPLEVKNRK